MTRAELKEEIKDILQAHKQLNGLVEVAAQAILRSFDEFHTQEVEREVLEARIDECEQKKRYEEIN